MCFLLIAQILPLKVAGAGSTQLNLLNGGAVKISESDPDFADVFQTLDLNAAASGSDLTLSFSFNLDNNYLNTKVEPVLEALSEEDAADLAKQDAACMAADDTALPPIRFQFSLRLDNTVAAPQTGTFDLWTDAADGEASEKIGSYTVALGSGDDANLVTVTCSLNKIVYNRVNVSARANLTLEIQNGSGSTSTPGLDVKNGEVTVTATPSGGGSSSNPPDATFSLVKAIASRSDSNSPDFSYTITATATSADTTVNGLTISDPIPDGMEVTGVKLGNVVLAPTEYTIENGILSYTLPASDGGSNDMTSAVLTVNTALTSAWYQQYVSNKNGVSWTFNNTATLKSGGSTSTLATSNQVSTPFQGFFMSKNGAPAGVNGDYYQWTIKANTYFSSSGHVYLVDTISDIDTTHMYDVQGGKLNYTINNADTRVASQVTDSTPYGSLTIEKLNELTGCAGAPNTDSATPVYYTYNNGTGTGDNTAVLVIPLKTTDLNAPLTVRYLTRLVSLSDKETFVARTLDNSVKILWDTVSYTPGGSGSGSEPGTVPSPSYTIDKEVTATYSLLTKTTGTYAQASRSMAWNFTVNQCGKALDAATVTDVLDDGIQTFSGLTYQVQTTSGTTVSTAIPGGTTGSPTPYYTLSPDSATHKTTLTIYLGNVAASELYLLTLNTTVVNPVLLYQQSNSVKISNSATINTTIDGTAVEKSTPSVSTNLSNTLLKKDAMKQNGTSTGSEYSFTDHSVKWRVTMNPNHVPIQGAVLTDTLPEGTTFDALTSVLRNGNKAPSVINVTNGSGTVTFEDGLTIAVSTTSGTSASGYSKDAVVFTFDSNGGDAVSPADSTINDQFVFVFSTTVDPDYRSNVYTTNLIHQLVNQSTLNGTVVDPTGQNLTTKAINQSVSATQTFSTPVVAKSGTYHHNASYGDKGTVDYADWTIVINPDQIDLTGVQVLDQLVNCLELDTDSLHVYSASVSANGTAAKGTEITGNLSFSTCNSSGFSFTIPAAYATTPMIITLNTLVVETADASSMKNTVTLKWAGGSSTNSGESNAGGAVSFDADSYATATTAPLLQVLKSSSNSALDGSGKPLYPLAGAVFTLTPMKDDGSGNWVVDASANPKVRTTSSSGLANFFFLRKGIIYRLEETAAPIGYTKDSSVYYYVFPQSGVSYPGAIDGVTVNTVTSSSTRQMIQDTPDNATPGGGGTAGYTLSFVKETDTGAALAGVTFRLKSAKLKDQTAISGQDGTVTFANLDAGTYTLEETVPDAYEPSSSSTVTITLSGGVYSVSMSGADVSTDQTTGGYVLTNHYIRGTASLAKTDSRSGSRISGAEFSVYQKDTDALVAYLTESGTAGTYTLSDTNQAGNHLLTNPVTNSLNAPVLSSQGGTLMLLAGDYYVTETTTPTGYLPDNDSSGALIHHAFSIASVDQACVITNNTQATAFTNEPFGIITGQKISNWKLPLANATIGLFPAGTTSFVRSNLYDGRTALSETDGSFTFTQVPYGTYVIAELTAPSGYSLNAKTSYTVAVNQNTSVITKDVNGANLVIENAAIPSDTPTGNLSIQKTSGDGVLAGFTFVVTNTYGYHKEFVTDSTGMILINNLPVGTYTVAEKSTAQTAKHYIIPEAQTLTLTAGGAKVNFFNALVPVTPTTPTVPGTTTPGGETDIDDNGIPTGTKDADDPSHSQQGENAPIYGPKTGISAIYEISEAALLPSLLGFGVCLFFVSRSRRRDHSDSE